MLNDLTEQEFYSLEKALAKIEELHSVWRLRDYIRANNEEIRDILNGSTRPFNKPIEGSSA